MRLMRHFDTKLSNFLDTHNFKLCIFCIWHTYLSHSVLKLCTVAQGSILDVGPIIVNCVDAIVQKFCYLAAVGYAEPDECEDAYYGVERLVVGWHNTVFWFQQSVELVDKRREELQECVVEVLIQFVGFLACEVG